jgi:hypothetical protein
MRGTDLMLDIDKAELAVVVGDDLDRKRTSS